MTIHQRIAAAASLSAQQAPQPPRAARSLRTDRATTRRMKLSTRRWLSISRAAPSGSPAYRQAISRRRELAVIPSAAGPTAAMR